MTPRNAALVATLTEPLSPDGSEIRRYSEVASWLELRADLIGPVDVDWLRDRFAGRLLYTLRSAEEGGRFEGGREERAERILAESRGFDLVDLEAERDRDGGLLAAVAPERRLLSWHGRYEDPPTLLRRFEEMASTEAAFYKLIPEAAREGEETAPLELLRQLERRDVIAFATGARSSWTRLVAPRLGAPVVYGAASGLPAAPGQLSLERLRRDFGLPELPPAERIFGIVGNPVSHSLSPRLHNGAYRALGLDALYLPFEPDSFGDFWLEVVEGDFMSAVPASLDGLSVTAPFKDLALAVAGVSSPLAEAIQSANTLVRRDGVWEAESTDPEGVLGPLRRRGLELGGQTALVVGTGGAGRAAAAGLRAAGSKVTLTNRTTERGKLVARGLDLAFVPWGEAELARFEIVVQATSLGHRPDDPLPFAVEELGSGAVIVDLVYSEEPTELVLQARESGHEAVDGREVLLFQALDQFRLQTGEELPVELGAELLGLEGVA